MGGPGLTPMTHAPETSTIKKDSTFFHHQFLVRVSRKSGTGFVWYQIPAPIRRLFYSKPESGVHVAEMIIYDLLLFNLPLATTPGVIIVAASANSPSTSLSTMLIFSTRNFRSRCIWYEKLACPKNGAGFWSVFTGISC